MSDPVWLVHLRGQAELTDAVYPQDGAIVRAASHSVIAYGAKVGFLGQRTSWLFSEHFAGADGDRASFSTPSSGLVERPPDGLWLRSDLVVRHGSTHLGTLGWLGIHGQAEIAELGVTATDPAMEPRRIDVGLVTGWSDRSLELSVETLGDMPVLLTDHEMERDAQRRLLEISRELPREAFERITVAVRGGRLLLGGMVPLDHHRVLARGIVEQTAGIRGVVDVIESAESLSLAARRTAGARR